MRTCIFLMCLLLALPSSALAQNTPVGRWKTIDDASGEAKSIVEIYDAGGGTLAAKVIRIVDPKEDPNARCDKCKGARKDQPVVGMVIAWDLKREGKSWGGGRILDPDNGKEYSAKMTPVAGGRKLEVRGFLGISLLGRTQVWLRE